MKRLLLASQVLLILILVGLTLTRVGARNATFNRMVAYVFAPVEEREQTTVEQVISIFAFPSPEDRLRYERYQARLITLAAQSTTPEIRRYRLGREALDRAKQAEIMGRHEKAAEQYRMAQDEGSEQVQLEALLGLSRSLSALGDDASADEALSEASAFELPGVIIKQDVCPGWRLVGAYVNRQDINFGVPVHVVMAWERRDDASTKVSSLDMSPREGWEYYPWEGKVFQVGQVENYLRDGGFSQVVSLENGIPAGLKTMFSAQTPDDTRFMTDPSLPERAVFLRFESQGGHSVGIRSESFPVQQKVNEGAYLVGATFRSVEDSLPRIGIYWRFPGAKTVEDNETDYAVTYPVTQWRQVTYLTTPPPGAEHMDYWAFEANSQAFLDIDDLFLLPLPLHCFTVEGE